MDIMGKGMELIMTMFMIMTFASILIIPNLSVWGNSLSSVSGYDLSGLPVALFIVILFVIIMGFMYYVKHKGK